MTERQLLLFDENQACAHCGAPLPAFEDRKYCGPKCRKLFHSALRNALADGGDRAPTSIYLYYDRDDVLLYVGVTSRGWARNIEHNKSKVWWKYVVRQEVEHHLSRASALQRETSLIKRHMPPFNKQQNPHYKAAQEAYFARQSVGGAAGVQLLADGRNRLPLPILNKVGDCATFMVSDPRILFTDVKKIRVDSGRRGGKIVDTGVFEDGSGTWIRVSTRCINHLVGAIVMFKDVPKSADRPVKLLKLVYEEDGINVWNRVSRKRVR